MKALLAKLKLDRYVIAAIVSNGIGFLIYSFLTLKSFSDVPQNNFFIASLTVLPFSYWINRMWVFESNNIILPEIMKFTIGYLVFLAAGFNLLPYLNEFITNPYLAQFTSMTLLGIGGFTFHSLLTFSNRKIN